VKDMLKRGARSEPQPEAEKPAEKAEAEKPAEDARTSILPPPAPPTNGQKKTGRSRGSKGQARDAREYVTVALVGCARCGETHTKLKLTRLSKPLVLNVASGERLEEHRIISFDHWGMCPKMKEPILAHVEVNVPSA